MSELHSIYDSFTKKNRVNYTLISWKFILGPFLFLRFSTDLASINESTLSSFTSSSITEWIETYIRAEINYWKLTVFAVCFTFHLFVCSFFHFVSDFNSVSGTMTQKCLFYFSNMFLLVVYCFFSGGADSTVAQTLRHFFVFNLPDSFVDN